MMSFRQECSAGRLVGFLWLVINPPGVVNSNPMLSSKAGLTEVKDTPKTETQPLGPDAPEGSEKAQVSDAPKGDKASVSQPSDQARPQRASDGSAFYWPQAARGHAVLNEEDYKTAINFLLEQDFYNEEVSFASTKAFNDKVAALADELWIGQQVVGKNTNDESTVPAQTPTTHANIVLVRKRKKDEGAASSQVPSEPTESTQDAGVNVLQGNLIRKKKKT
jgi:regulator of Ty1 transposition protein 109